MTKKQKKTATETTENTKEADHKPSKEHRLFLNLLKTTKQFIQGKSYHPISQAELFERLHFAPQHSELFQNVLDSLRKQGEIELEHGRIHSKRMTNTNITGLLHLNPRGFGFVTPNPGGFVTDDVFIPKQYLMNAIDADEVEVQVNPIISEKGPEGRVVAILSRSRSHVTGYIVDSEPNGDLLAYIPQLGSSQRIVVERLKDFPLQIGDRLVMEVVEWGSKETETLCKPTRLIGNISDPSADILMAIEEAGIRTEFPNEAIEEAKKIGTRVSIKDISGREDLRNLETFTIDPDTAKDFDDALSLSKDNDGHYHLAVHIADVSHYVRLGSDLDKEARLRCNSTYFPGKCIPMLPSELSDNLCSLKANVNRLTASVLMEFDPTGDLIHYRLVRSVIKSMKRFTYREAKDVIDNKKKSPHKKTLDLMVELCRLLKKKRYERGSIEFALPELVIMVDEKGVPTKTDYIEYDVSHQLVEEFMLKANELVATHLSKAGRNVTFRIHDVPAEENMRDFSLLAGAFGFTLSDKPTSAEIQALFDEALHTPYGPYLATSYIRRMRLATYSPDNIGHYGLGLTHYCHFTSPIRRYVDLVAHRILFGDIDDRKELKLIAERCSERERISAKAENNVILLKKLRLLNQYSNDNPDRQYDALVTRIKPFGFFFEIIELMLEGFLHVSELDNDYFLYSEEKMQLRGKHSGKNYAAGDKITVQLKDLNLIMQSTEWHLVSEEQPREEQPRRRKFGSRSKTERSSKPKSKETTRKSITNNPNENAKKKKRKKHKR